MPAKAAKPKPADQLAALHARRTQLRAEQRQAVLTLQAAEREHQQLERTIQVGHDRALALNEPAPTDQDTTALAAAADKLEATTEQVNQYERMINVINEEISAVRRDNADELLREQLDLYAGAAERVDQIIDRLTAELEVARACSVNAQTILRDAGRNHETAYLRVPPTDPATVIRNGGLGELLPTNTNVTVSAA